MLANQLSARSDPRGAHIHRGGSRHFETTSSLSVTDLDYWYSVQHSRLSFLNSWVTVRNTLPVVTSMKRDLPPLGDLEHEILTIVWAGGEMTAASVRKKISRKLKDATVRTVLRRLEDKGYITHRIEAGTFIYTPRETAESTAAKAIGVLIEKFCGGSIERALQAFSDATRIEPQQLAAIATKLKQKSRL